MNPNEQLVRNFFAAFDNGDMQALGDILADDVIHHEPGLSDLAGDYEGKEMVFDFFRRIGERTNGTLHIEAVRDVFGSDDRAVALFTAAGERDGEVISWDVAEVYEVKAGKITDIRAHVFNPTDLDRVFGQSHG